MSLNHCFVLLFHALLVYSTSSFVLQNGIQNVHEKNDPNSPICIEIINETSCFPKVGLNQECELDEQCSSKTSNSFCALLDDYQQNDYSTLDIRPVCLCRDGFNPSMGHLHCVPVQYCTYTGFNSIMEQMDCEDVNQFCRESVCLCIPNHDLDYSGKCVPVQSNFSLHDVLLKAKKSNKLVSLLENVLLSQRTSTNKVSQSCLLLKYLGVALFLLGQIAWSLYL